MSELCFEKTATVCEFQSQCVLKGEKCRARCTYGDQESCENDLECYHDGEKCNTMQLCSDEPQSKACIVSDNGDKLIDCNSMDADLLACKSMFGCKQSPFSDHDCNCQDNFVISHHACIPWCVGNQVPDENRYKCVCKQGYYGDQCQKQCTGKNKVVINNDCVCAKGYNTDASGNCIKCDTKNLQEFDTDIQQCKCVAGAVQVGEVCECDVKQNMYPGDADNCIQCDPTNHEYSEQTKTCNCRNGQFGENCEIQCVGEHKVFKDGVCRCVEGYFGSDCQVQCQGNGKVFDGQKCICDTNYNEGLNDTCIYCSGEALEQYNSSSKQCDCVQNASRGDKTCKCNESFNKTSSHTCIQCDNATEQFDIQQSKCVCQQGYSSDFRDICVQCDATRFLVFDGVQRKCVCYQNYSVGESGECELRNNANKLSVGAIAGIVVGILALVGAIVAIIVFSLKKKNCCKKSDKITQNLDSRVSTSNVDII